MVIKCVWYLILTQIYDTPVIFLQRKLWFRQSWVFQTAWLLWPCCSFEHNTISVNISRVHTKTYNIEYTGKYLTWQTLKIYSHNRKWNYSSTENERYSYSVINAVELKLLGSYLLVVTHLLTGADPGFAVGGGANPRREGGASRYKFVRFSEKTAWN